MKHLIIYAHPNSSSINAQLKQHLVNHLQEHGQELVIRDLYQLNFNPVLSLSDMEGQRKGQVAADVAEEQEFIKWTDRITFIYPIWWTGLPAIMKGYIDRVFSYGFAYQYNQGVQEALLTGKEAVVINTHGKSNDEYQAIGMDKALSLTSDKGVYTYCELEITKHLFFGKADRASKETINNWTNEVLSLYSI